MKVIEHLARAKDTLISFEIVPPLRGKTIKEIFNITESLLPFNPSWIEVTAHASVSELVENPDGSLKRIVSKKRPGTIGICGVIQNRFQIDAVTHLLCLGYSKEETEDALIELNYLGIENILALRGDLPNFQKPLLKEQATNEYAIDLVKQISDLKKGKFTHSLEDSSKGLDFCVGVAGYPEKHLEAPNLQTDLQFLKAKVDAGSDYIVSQMFFDNSKYFQYVNACRDLKIEVPIIPGLKVIRTPAQLKRLPKTFNVDIPSDVSREIMENPKHAEEIGIEHCFKQCEELLNHNVPVLHFYVLNDASAVSTVLKKLGF
jgi:methylenetetrahydrofolate reductase (NADPH)